MAYFIRVLLIGGVFGVATGKMVLSLTGADGLSMLAATLVTGLLLRTSFWELKPRRVVDEAVLPPTVKP